MPSWPKQVFGESVWLRLLSGAGEEGLIRASVPHLCTHRLSKNVCHHHVRRGCPPRRCPRQRRPPVRATRERRARRRGSIPPARLASGLGSQRARRVFAATGAGRARADRDRERAREPTRNDSPRNTRGTRRTGGACCRRRTERTRGARGTTRSWKSAAWGACASPSRSSACTCTTRTSSRRGTTSWASGAKTRWTKSKREMICEICAVRSRRTERSGGSYVIIVTDERC